MLHRKERLRALCTAKTEAAARGASALSSAPWSLFWFRRQSHIDHECYIGLSNNSRDTIKFSSGSRKLYSCTARLRAYCRSYIIPGAMVTLIWGPGASALLYVVATPDASGALVACSDSCAGGAFHKQHRSSVACGTSLVQTTHTHTTHPTTRIHSLSTSPMRLVIGIDGSDTSLHLTAQCLAAVHPPSSPDLEVFLISVLPPPMLNVLAPTPVATAAAVSAVVAAQQHQEQEDEARAQEVLGAARRACIDAGVSRLVRQGGLFPGVGLLNLPLWWWFSCTQPYTPATQTNDSGCQAAHPHARPACSWGRVRRGGVPG